MYDLKPHEPKPKRDWFAVRMSIMIILFVAVAVIIFVSISPRALPSLTQLQSFAPVAGPTATSDCRDEIMEYKRETLLPILEEWEDAYDLASSSSRMALAQPIATLQEINRRLKQVEPVPCAAGVHYLFIEATESTINGFLAFMANKPDREVMAHFETASFLLDALMEEDPEPTPTGTG